MTKYIVKLTEEERAELITMTKTGKASAKKLIHARILLQTDQSDSGSNDKKDADIARDSYVSEKTVNRIRKQFAEEGLEAALNRKPHSRARPRILQGDEEAHLITLCCSDPPEGRARWTLVLLADKLVALNIVNTISPTTVGRTLKKTN